MVSPVLSEHWYTGGFLVSEANGYRSRDVGTISNGTTADVTLEAGLVLALVPATTITAGGSNHGNGTLGSLTLGVSVMPGVYTALLLSSTAYTMMRPDGAALPAGTVGTAYSEPEIGLTVTAGTTAFAAGDLFSVTVDITGKVYASWPGSGIAPSAILFNRTVVPASSSKKLTVIARAAEVNFNELQWDPAVLASVSPTPAALEATAAAALAAGSGILAR